MLQGLKNIGQAAAGANKLRQQQAKLQKLLAEIEVEGKSKNGKVTIWMNGKQEVVRMFIDPSLIDFVQENFFKVEVDTDRKEDFVNKGQKFLSSPIIEAITDATSKVQNAIVKKMQENGGIGDLMSMLQAAGGN
jgi:DNA-binding protein YbaB